MKYPELTVSALIYNPQDQILLCRSHKWDDRYSIPGGHVEYGETLEEALRREIDEETFTYPLGGYIERLLHELSTGRETYKTSVYYNYQ